MTIPSDYAERVYAGVLGKIIGVYLGRPFEGWTHEKIMGELGEIYYYVHQQCGVPLIVTDDDISGTFTFVRALADFGNSKDLTEQQIGQTWLNYLVEKRSVLWWGGLGNSTEHTAYIRLKKGISAPISGSIATNGKVVAEQIGAQIFIDAWAMVAPGDPALAVELAKRAASVSHDGEAVYGAQVLAAMEAQAFIEQDIDKLLDCGTSFIPGDSIIYCMIANLRNWHTKYHDWTQTLDQIISNYGYDKYGGNCHIVPNHALIILGLLYGEGDFQKSLMITNTAGWDTDCNSGNLGCLIGIRNGLVGFDFGPDWRGPLADRLYLPTADGGRAITDALIETYAIVNSGRALQGLASLLPKEGARFHFSLPGSVQGFQPEPLVDGRSPARVLNVEGHSKEGTRSLAIAYTHTAPGQPARVATHTFIDTAALNMPGNPLMACPTLYPGQEVTALVEADALNQVPVDISLYLRYFGAGDVLQRVQGPKVNMHPAECTELTWQIPETGSYPIAEIGLEIDSALGRPGIIYLDKMNWSGTARTTFTRPASGVTKAWQLSWINAVSDFVSSGEPFRLIQDDGTGLLIQGSAEWHDYRVETVIIPHMAVGFGLAARVQGLLRYYGLVLDSTDQARLIKVFYDKTFVLGEVGFFWKFGQPVALALEVKGHGVTAFVDGKAFCSVQDTDEPFISGGIALLVRDGRAAANSISIHPL